MKVKETYQRLIKSSIISLFFSLAMTTYTLTVKAENSPPQKRISINMQASFFSIVNKLKKITGVEFIYDRSYDNRILAANCSNIVVDECFDHILRDYNKSYFFDENGEISSVKIIAGKNNLSPDSSPRTAPRGRNSPLSMVSDTPQALPPDAYLPPPPIPSEYYAPPPPLPYEATYSPNSLPDDAYIEAPPLPLDATSAPPPLPADAEEHILTN